MIRLNFGGFQVFLIDSFRSKLSEMNALLINRAIRYPESNLIDVNLFCETAKPKRNERTQHFLQRCQCQILLLLIMLIENVIIRAVSKHGQRI